MQTLKRKCFVMVFYLHIAGEALRQGFPGRISKVEPINTNLAAVVSYIKKV
jgi:hypothetical protein